MRVNGTDLHVEPATGAGELLVLVHGGWTDHTTFDAVAGPLAESFRVVRYDRRGHSRSPYGPGPSPRRREEDDLAALIEAHGEPAHLVGTSYGALISLALAGRRPELVRSVVAHEPPALAHTSEPEAEALMRSVWRQLADGDAEGGTRRFFEEGALGPGGWLKLPEPLRAASVANAQTFLDLRDEPGFSRLDVDAVARCGRPVLVTLGDTGPGWLPRTARALAAQLGVPAHVYPGAGHSPHLTHPAALVALVRAFAGGEDVARAA